MNRYTKRAHNYKDVVTLFLKSNPEDLEVINEDTLLEKIKHTPSGWYFYTDEEEEIAMFHRNLDCGQTESIEAPIFGFYIGLFSNYQSRICEKIQTHRRIYTSLTRNKLHSKENDEKDN